MRKIVSTLVVGASLLISSAAFAQDFGEQGTAALSIDRAFGLTFSHVSWDPAGPADETETDWTSFSFGWRGRIQPSPFEVPRLAFDYFVIDSLSIGGALGYSNLDDDDDDDENDDDDFSEFIFAPRVGYIWMFSDVAGFWLRGGFTYHSTDGGQDVDGFAFTVEPTFAIIPVDHFGFTAGLTADFDLFGSADNPGPGDDADVKYRTIGLQLGMLGYF